MAKVTDVQAVQPNRENAPPGWRRVLGQVGVRVTTDDGVVGYGVSGGGAASLAIINELLRGALVGADLDEPDDFWQRLYDETLPYGRAGLAMMAISGVDTAAWDCRSQLAGVSMVEYLGGSRVDAIPGYITAPDSYDILDLRGIQGVKIAVPRGRGPDWAISELRRARTELGDGVDLMVDVGMWWDEASSRTFLEGAEDLGVAWLEEPLPPDDVVGHRALRQLSTIKIAGGEHESSASAYQRFLDADALDIVQPDITWCGGLTQLIKVFGMAAEYGVRVCPHRGGDAWALPAIAALGDYYLAEQARTWVPELNGPVSIDEAGYRVASAPGFGVHMNLNWNGAR